MTRWLFSTNCKIFTILCLVFAVFSGMLDFAFSVLIIDFDFFSTAKLVLTCATGIPIKPGEGTISSTEKDSSQKPLKLSNEQKEAFSLSPELADILIGLCLGDLCIEKLKTSINARLRFLQSINHTDYLEHLWDKFQDYSRQEPKIINRKANKITGKEYSSIYFTTFSLPCFNKYYDLFYQDGRKIVPQKIGELLTPIGLAFLISDDGDFNKKSQRVTLNTQGFTQEEVNLLGKTLNDNWNLECVVYKTGKGCIISIPRKSLPILQKICAPKMPPMMLYKIGL
jgi:hypothetical protein